MVKNRVFNIIALIFFVAFLLIVFFNANFTAIYSLPQETYVAYDDIDTINNKNIYGKLIKANLAKDDLAVGEESPKSGKVIFKLFGFIPIRSVNVDIIVNEKVFLGGNALGFSINTKGVIVVGKNSVLTSEGSKVPKNSQQVYVGDVITQVNGKDILCVEDLVEEINMCNNDKTGIELNVKRKEKFFKITIFPEQDSSSNRKKIGLWVRDDASGVGTLTYVDENSLEFGALGHPITDNETGAKLDVKDGKLFGLTLIGIEKGSKSSPGQLKGVFLESTKPKGEITKSNDFGLFGSIKDKDHIIDENVMANVGSRLSVMPGKAKLISSVSGVRGIYDIEIIKASKQSSAKDKSMVIKVTDKRLLALTGGIVQGMSGSPIMQNGKLVGALTHVFVSDSTKGYGIYIDWMKNK